MIPQQGVRHDEELSHDGGEGKLRRFSRVNELRVLRLQIGIEANRDEGGHVKRAPYPRAATLYSRRALPFAGLSRDRGQACECRDLLCLESAKFRHVNEHGDRGEPAHAWNAGQNIHSLGNGFIFVGLLAHPDVELRDVPRDLGQPPLDLASQQRHRRRGQTRLRRRLIFDQGTARRQQFLEVMQAFVRLFLRLKVKRAAHTRQHFRIVVTRSVLANFPTACANRRACFGFTFT